MKRFLSILILCCAVSAFGAVTPAGVVFETNGAFADVYLSTASVPLGGAYTNVSGFAWGFGTNNSLVAPAVAVTLNSPGFDSTGVSNFTSRTLYGTHEVRQAYPNMTNVDASVNGSGIIVRISQSENVWSSDTNLSVIFTANWYSNNSSGTVVGTNNSTLAAPVVIGQWDHIAGVCTADRVSGDFSVAFNARHALGIACVKFDATGETSSYTASATVSIPTFTKRTGTLLQEDAYVATISISGFTSGEVIDLRARAYPKYGTSSAVLDTDTHTTANEECLGWNKAKVVYNSTVKYAFVATNGNDSTAVASTTMTTASNSPFLSIGKAIENDATTIYLFDGTHPAIRNSPSSRRAPNEWYVVQPCATGSVTSVTVQITQTRAYSCQRLEYKNVKVTLLDGSSWLDGQDEGDSLRFVGCTFTNGGVGQPLVSPGYRSYVTYFENCPGDLGVNTWELEDFSTARIAFQFDGCQFKEATASANAITPWFRVVACTSTGAVGFAEHVTGNPAPAQDNVFFDNNYFLNFNSSSVSVLKIADTVAVANGASVCDNLVEQLTSGQSAFWLGADGSTANFDHLILWNNTCVGGRFNVGYNDNGSTARLRRNWSVRNNFADNIATKHDLFGTPNAARVGAWNVLYGVGWSGNVDQEVVNVGTSGGFCHDFFGLNSFEPTPIFGTSSPSCGTTSATFAQFVSRQAYDGSNVSGNGNYRLKSSSPFLAIVTAPFPRNDIEGVPRGGFDPPGAYASASPRKGGAFFGF